MYRHIGISCILSMLSSVKLSSKYPANLMIASGGMGSPVLACLRKSKKDAADASFSISIDSASDSSTASCFLISADFFCSLASSVRVLR
jgi:hypothetical protein